MKNSQKFQSFFLRFIETVVNCENFHERRRFWYYLLTNAPQRTKNDENNNAVTIIIVIVNSIGVNKIELQLCLFAQFTIEDVSCRQGLLDPTRKVLIDV